MDNVDLRQRLKGSEMICKPPRQLRVFIVDEAHLFASCLAEILRRKGHLAHSFADPLEALFAARSEPPDILISDVALEMPTGIHLAARMREDFPACQALLFSKDVRANSLLSANAPTAGDEIILVSAPVDFFAFMEHIENLIQSALSPEDTA